MSFCPKLGSCSCAKRNAEIEDFQRVRYYFLLNKTWSSILSKSLGRDVMSVVNSYGIFARTADQFYKRAYRPVS